MSESVAENNGLARRIERALFDRYDLCARNHDASAYLSKDKPSDSEEYVDRLEWATRRHEAMTCWRIVTDLIGGEVHGEAREQRAAICEGSRP